MLSRSRREGASFPSPPPGVTLGPRRRGALPLPLDGRGRFIWPFEQMRRHAVVVGASGSGKTETSMRLAAEVASKTDASIFYLDPKGDRRNAERFCALARAAGRNPRVFPNQPIDAWRGDWRAIVNRLLQVIQFASEGPAAYYRDIAKSALQLACHHPDGPPRCSAELLHRLDYERLLDAHGSSDAVRALAPDRVSQVHMRYRAFFGQLGSQLDGDWSFEDTDCGYLLFDSLALGEDTCSAASLLFTDFAHYFTQRKPAGRLCVMICDEFGAISRTADLALKVEQARAFDTSLVLVPQTLGGLGPEWQCDRILGSVETIFAHALNEPERVAALAGHRGVPEITHRIEAGSATYSGLSRTIQRPVVRQDQIRQLAVGEACLIRRGLAATLRVEPAATVDPVPLPAPAPIDLPLHRVDVAAPKRISYLEGD